MSYRVFVSSTSLDNAERRERVRRAIVDAGMVPVGMERFTAAVHPTLDECLDEVRGCDVLVGIVAWRYGSRPPGQERSYTELEYEAATDRLMFELDPASPVVVDRDFDSEPGRAESLTKLQAFKSRYAADQMPARFKEDELEAKVYRALEAWKDGRGRRQTGAPPPAPRPATGADPDAEVALYQQRAESLHATLPIAGFSTKLRVPVGLEEMYVPLHAIAHLRASGEARFADAEDAERKLGDAAAASEVPLTEAFACAEKLGGRRGLVILGDPGSGKTTHLQRVLLWLIRQGPESLHLPSGMVPVLLPLRDLDDLGHGLDAFIERQLDHPHLRMQPGFGARLLARGNLLFLLDGLDEVADAAERVRVAKWIDEAVIAHSTCRFAVSCRFAGYDEESRLSALFLELHLRPLDAEQVSRFVHNWYRIVERGLRTDPEQAASIARERADELLQRLNEPEFRARRVLELTRNPLLLANLCLIHRDRGQLPRRRAQLYAECIDVLLERWRAAKRLTSRITADQGRRVLQPAALWLHGEEGRTRAPADELVPVLEPALQAVLWEGDARSFLRAVRDESGLLTGWDQQRYGFMHLGFQEYLAAREIRRRHFGGEREALPSLAARFGESWWQEVILLLVALDDPSTFEPFLREVGRLPALADHGALLDAVLEDAAEVSVAPFVELAGSAPGRDPSLWARQLLALRVLERVGPSSLDDLAKTLANHPSPEVQRWLRDRGVAAAAETMVTANGGVELVRIQGERFMMGSPGNEEGRYSDEGLQHRVTVPGFYLGRYPVTNQEYARFLAANPEVKEPPEWSNRQFNQARQPVVGVSWDEARRFAEWAGCRLPSEAEWEYAARAGTKAPYLEGLTEEDLGRFGWYSKNSGGQSHPVGEKAANAWGLNDVLGNVWEWVEDDWHDTYHEAPSGGSPWIDKPRGAARVIRGGSWDSSARLCRVAFRGRGPPGYRLVGRGLRVARSLPSAL